MSLIAADPGWPTFAAVPDETAVPIKEIGHATNVRAKDLAEVSEWLS